MQKYINTKKICTMDNNYYVDAHCTNNDVNHGTRFYSISKKNSNSRQKNSKIKNVEVQCNDFKTCNSKALYVYELLIKCNDIHQIHHLRTNILKSSIILQEKISNSIEEFDHVNGLSKRSHPKCKIECENLKNYNEKLVVDNVHFDFSKCSKMKFFNECNHNYLIYKLVLECIEPLQIELINCALFEDTIVICSTIKVRGKKCSSISHPKEVTKKKINWNDIKFEDHTNKFVENSYGVQDLHTSSKKLPALNTNISKNIILQTSCNAKNLEIYDNKQVFYEDLFENNSNKNNTCKAINTCESNQIKSYSNEKNKRSFFLKHKKPIQLKVHRKFVNKLFANTMTDNFNRLKNLINTSMVDKSNVEDCIESLQFNNESNKALQDDSIHLKPPKIMNEDLTLNKSISTLLFSSENIDYYNKKNNENNIHVPLDSNINSPLNGNSSGIGIRPSTVLDFEEINKSSSFQCHIAQPQSYEFSKNDSINANHFNQSILSETFIPQTSISKCIDDIDTFKDSIYHSNNDLNLNLKVKEPNELNVLDKHCDGLNCINNNSIFQMANISKNEMFTNGENSLYNCEDNNFITNSSNLELQNMPNYNKESTSLINFNPIFNNKKYNDFKDSQDDNLNSFNLKNKKGKNILNDNALKESYVIDNHRSSFTICQKKLVDKNVDASTKNMYNVQNSSKPIKSLETQSPIEIVIEKPPIDHIDRKYQPNIINKESITIQNDKTLYNNIFNNHHVIPTQNNTWKNLSNFECTKNDLQNYEMNGNTNENTMPLNPFLLGIVVDPPPPIQKYNPSIQNHQISNNTNEIFNAYGQMSCMVGKEIQTDLSGPPEDENIFCELDGYVCLKDDEIICKKKRKRKKNSSINQK